MAEIYCCPKCRNLLQSVIYYAHGEPQVDWKCPHCGWSSTKQKTMVSNKTIVIENKRKFEC